MVKLYSIVLGLSYVGAIVLFPSATMELSTIAAFGSAVIVGVS